MDAEEKERMSRSVRERSKNEEDEDGKAAKKEWESTRERESGGSSGVDEGRGEEDERGNERVSKKRRWR